MALLAVLTAVGSANAQATQLITLTATANGPTQIDLSWNTPSIGLSSSITGYQIEVSPSGTAGTWTDLVVDTASTGTTYSDTSVTAGATRYYRIPGVWFKGISPTDLITQATEGLLISNMASATTDSPTVVPSAPTGLTATADGQTRINLSWTAPTGAAAAGVSGYKIEVSPSGDDSSWTTLATDTGSVATTYTHTSLVAGATRHYRVSAINSVGTSGTSTTANATTDPLNAPTNLTATANGQTQIDLSWTAPSGNAPTGYKIEVSPSGADDTWTTLKLDTGSAATTYSNSGLTAATTRYYQVSAINALGTSAPSTKASATTDSLKAPTGLTATIRGQTRIDLSWTAPAVQTADAPTGYKIEVSPSGADGTWTELAANTDSTDSTYSDTNVTAGTTRYYQVSAIGPGGTSGPSNVASAATVAPGKPTGLTATASGQTLIKLSWTAPSTAGVLTYKIEVSPSGADDTWTTLVADTGSAATTYSHIGLTPGTTRHYRVSAINALGTSDPSDKADARTEAVGHLRVEPLPNALRVSFVLNIATSYLVQWRTSGQYFSESERFANRAPQTYTIMGLKPGTEYWVRVTGLATSVRPNVVESSGMPLLGKVSGVTSVGASGDALHLTWDEAAGAQSYAVQWKSGGQAWSGERQATTTGTTYTLSGLEAETAYTVRVRAQRSDISPGAWSDEATGTTLAATVKVVTLPSVTDLSVESVSATSLKASWSAVLGVDSYTVQWRKPRTGQKWGVSPRTASATSTSHTFTVDDADIDEGWTVRVRPETTSGAFGPWAYAYGVQTALVPPTGLTATATGSGTVNLAWTAPSVAGKTIGDYAVQWESATPVDRGELRTDSTNATATVTGLRPGTKYTFYVSAVFNDKAVSLPATATATTSAAGAAPGKPTGLTATAVAPTTIQLSWTPATGEGVTGYGVQSRTGSGGWTNVVTDTGNSYPGYVHIGLEPGTTYHYQVIGGNAAGISPWSDEANAMTLTYDPIAFRYEIPDSGYWENQGFKEIMPEAYNPGGSAPHGPYRYTLTLEDGSALPDWLRFNAATRALTSVEPGSNPVNETVTLKWTAAERDAPSVTASQTFMLHHCETEADRQIEACEATHPDNTNAQGDGQASGQQQTEPANQAPTFDAGIVTTLALDENSAAATSVGDPITATDPDDGDTVTYSLSGTDAASFAIGSSTGQITTVANVVYNYEAKSSYSLELTAADGRGLSVSTPVTVNLNNVNEAPAFADDVDTTLSVDENSAAGTSVGSAITATDPEGDTLTYSLVGFTGSEADAAAFEIGSASGQITTKSGVTYDRDTKSTYTFIVVATEKDTDEGLTNAVMITVNLTNVEEGGATGQQQADPVNRAPAFDAGIVTTLSVDENSAAGTSVGSAFTATDPDSGDTLAYSLSGDDAAAFNIGALTGQIVAKAGETYNYEAKSSYSLTVVVTDTGSLTDRVAVTVSLNNVAEAPTVSDTTQFKNHAATVGQTFSLTLPAADANSGDGGPYEYLLWHRGHGENFMDQAINGLSFNTTTRTLSGTPTAAGVWKLSYVVHDDDDDRSVEDRFRAKTNLQITVAQ